MCPPLKVQEMQDVRIYIYDGRKHGRRCPKSGCVTEALLPFTFQKCAMEAEVPYL